MGRAADICPRLVSAPRRRAGFSGLPLLAAASVASVSVVDVRTPAKDEEHASGWVPPSLLQIRPYATALPERRSWRPGEHDVATSVAAALSRRLARCPAGAGTARCAGDSLCAEEDSNLHPLSVDQALNLVTRVSDPSYASVASRTSGDRDASDVMDALDVAAYVAAGSDNLGHPGGAGPAPSPPHLAAG